MSVILTNASSSGSVATVGPSIRNFLINSAFDFWQRGTSTTIANTATSYQPDRWYGKNSLGTNGVLTLSQTTGVTDGSLFGASLKITTAPTVGQTNGTELYQTLENMDSISLYNKSASFSVLVKALGNVNQVGVQFYYATTEVKVTTAIGSEILTTVNSSTFTTCTISNQALGTSQTTSGVIGVRIRITAVSSGNTYDLNNGFVCEQAIINTGTTAASYQRAGKTTQAELYMCTRFYEKSYNLTTALGTTTSIGAWEGSIAYNGSTCFGYIPFRVRKRTTPTMTYYSNGSGAAGAWRTVTTGGSADNGRTIATDTAGESGTSFSISVAGSTELLGAGQWVADAEI